MATSVRIRTEVGEETLDLEEFEERIARGEVAPHCPVYFPTPDGPRWVRAGDLELFRARFDAGRHTFARRFHLARVPWATVALIAVNLGIHAYLTQDDGVDTDDMVRFGAKVAPLIGDLGQFWRLLAANFIHRDWVHVGFNMFVLFNVGGALENAYRPVDYLWVLYASALGCTVTSLALAPEAISVGASGMAYGAMGGALVFGLKYREILPGRYRRLLGEAAIPTILVFLYVGWSSVGVDNWGHLGGLLFGGAMAAFLPPRMLLAEPTTRLNTFTRLLPMVLLTLLLVFGGRAITPALPPLQAVRDDPYGLLVQVPTTWRRGAEQYGQLAYYNGLPGLGRARFAADAHVAETGSTLQDEARSFIQTSLKDVDGQKQLKDLVVEPVQATQLAGRDGLRVSARYRGDEGGLTRVRAYFVARGQVVYRVLFALSDAYPDYDRVADEMLEEIRFSEPTELREARARALLAPGSFLALSSLGDALAQLGELREAVNVYARAAALRPEDGGLLARYASALMQSGRIEDGCLRAHQAQKLAPAALEAQLAVADCQVGRGDRDGARTTLHEAQKLSPDHRGLLQRLRGLDEAR